MREPQCQTQGHSNSTALECLGTQKPANTDGLPEKKQQEVQFTAGRNGVGESRVRPGIASSKTTSPLGVCPASRAIYTKNHLQMTPPHLPLEASESEASQPPLGSHQVNELEETGGRILFSNRRQRDIEARGDTGKSKTLITSTEASLRHRWH